MTNILLFRNNLQQRARNKIRLQLTKAKPQLKKQLASYLFLLAGLLLSQNAFAQTTVLNEGWESGTNGWTIVNGTQTNKWFVGSATAATGSNSAYISNNASGTTHNYSTTNTSTVHFYKDVTFPAGETDITLSFKWKNAGESGWDFIKVFLAPTTVTPTAGSQQSSNQIGLTDGYVSSSTFTTASFKLAAANAGTTKRLIFSWRNDGSGGSQPPGSIDDILITTAPGSPLTVGAITLQQTGGFVNRGSTNNTIARIEIPVNGTTGNLTLNSSAIFSLNTSDADISANGVKFWSGTATAPSTQIGTAQSFSGGKASFSSLNTALSIGSNYFWVTYDVAASATPNNQIGGYLSAGTISISASNGATAPGSQPSSNLNPGTTRQINFYCVPVISTGCGGDILNRVTVNTLNNNASGCNGNANSYINYPPSTYTTTLQRSTSHSATVSVTGDTEAVGIWLDWNQDGDFQDANEFMGSTAVLAVGATANLTINVPATANLGATRMRVRARYNTVLTATDDCSTYTYGETEDYTITVDPAPACPPPGNLSVSNLGLTTATLNWAATSAATNGYLLRYKKNSDAATVSTWATPTVLAAGTTSFNLSNLANGTQYEFQVQSDCGNGSTSSFSSSFTFSTLIEGATCAVAKAITLSPSGYSSGSLTTCGAGNDYGISGSSSYGAGEDYVFALTVTNAPVTYKFTLGGSGTYKSLTAFNGCPSPVSAPTNRVGGEITTGSGTTGSGTIQFATNGTYYLVVDHWPSPTCGNFTLDVTVPPPPPANDECANAVLLTPNMACTATAGTIFNATNSNIPASTGTADDDVWYKFEASDSKQIITLTSPSGTDLAMEIFSGACGSLVSKQSSDPNTMIVTGLTAGQTYFVRVYYYYGSVASAAEGDFTICIQSPPPPPANDECASAITLTHSGTCNPTTGTLYGATQSGPTALNGTADDDVWYKFVATQTQANFTVASPGFIDLVTQVFSGSCGSLVSVVSSDPNTFSALGLTVGNTYYVRVFSYSSSYIASSAADGEFSICLTTPPAPLSYNVSRNTGVSFNSIANSGSCFNWTYSTTSTDDNLALLDLATLGFTGFSYQGNTVSALKVSTNGFLTFNSTYNSSSGAGNDFTTIGSVVAPFWEDLVIQGNPGTAPNTNICNFIKYNITGNPGSQVLTVEWREMETYGNAGPSLSFQVKLYEGSNRIEFVYGNMVGFNGTTDYTYSYSAGISGAAVASTPQPGELLAQQVPNANNFSNTLQNNLNWVPECYSKITFTPAASPTPVSGTISPITNQVCSSAIPLTVGTGVSNDFCQVYRSGLNPGETAPTITTACSPALTGSDDDVWFTFTTSQVTNNVVIVNGSGGYDAVVEMYSGTCGSLVAVNCKDATASGQTETLTNNLLPAGTYYVRVFAYGTGAPSSSGTFTISTYSTVAPPANDDCNLLAAYELTPGMTCSSTSSGNTANATATTGVTACNASTPGTADDDVWYSFVATSNTTWVEVTGNSGYNPVMQIYSGSCGSLANAGCFNSTSTGGTEAAFFNGNATVGARYYVRVYHAANGSTPTTGFNICITTPTPNCPTLSAPSNNLTGVDPTATRALSWTAPSGITPASYDVIVSANSNLSNPLISMNVTTTSYTIPANTLSSSTVYYWSVVSRNANGASTNCTVNSFTTTGTVPSCALNMAPQTGSTNLPLTQALTWTAGGGTPTGYDVYFGTAANSLVKVVSNGTATTYSPTLAYGTTYYWSVNPINSNGTATGCSVLSFTTVSAPPANDNCSGAIALTLSTPLNTTSVNATKSATGCVGNADDDVWYKFTANATNTDYTITATGNGSFNPVIQLYGTSCGSASLACSNANSTTSEVYAATGLTKGATYFFRVYNFAAGSGTFSIEVKPTVNDLIITSNQNVSGTYNNVTVQSGTATVTGPLTVSGNLTVKNGATLATRNNIISGGIFTLEAGGNLQIGSTAGISASGNTGNIQFTTRNFNTGANYVYNGTTGAQVTGTGLPATVQNITINNGNGVSLTNNLSVTRVVTLTNGNLNLGARTLTLVSNASGTAMVVNTNGIVNGTATMQRYISAGNGRGYRQYASPVVSAAISQLNDNGYTAIVNPAYNALPMPTIPFAQYPTIFKYDESRINASFDDFTTGWASPASTSEVMTRGRGYTVNIPRTTVDLSGTLNNGTVSVGTLSKGSANNSGWHLLGNPYPAPINWDVVRATLPAGMADAVYVFRSTGTYTGQYVSYVNGVGPAGANLIPAMQGFFVKVNSGTPAFSFSNAARLTTYANPAMYRQAETRPLLQLNLANATGKADELYIYQEAGATLDDDAQFDAYKVQGNGNDVPTLYSVTPNGKNLSISGLPAILVQETVIPLGIYVGTAGTYTFQAAQFLNFLAGMDVLLEDRQTGTLQNLATNGTYTCQLTAGSNVTRFALRLKPNTRVSGTADLLAGALKDALVFPNPTNNSKGFTLSIGGLQNEKLQVMLYNQVGQLVETRTITPTNGMVAENFSAEKLAQGIYTLKLSTNGYKVAKKVIIQ
ncbi:GEVED domain-containing protein [Adhaeribacter soli]|uniref:T9SS type A sorting domain-containing protein n=1 Tax=Adhaeribacter soli TaxID=2607655 RepID=A0A5N1INC8_9BACT|nr:GEVED domain-containing protein [Adhaeribacter soli]KAA9331248.1 T9SS type A sorting domain-containing protein [Adhaeribacter soli]